MTTAAMLGVDTCPLEGFIPPKYNEILGLTAQGYSAVVGCAALILIGIWPPHEVATWIVGGTAGLLVVGWFGGVRRFFKGLLKS